MTDYFYNSQSVLFSAEECQRRNSSSKSSNAYWLHKTGERSVSFGERISNFLSNDCVVILGLAKRNRHLEMFLSFIFSQIISRNVVQIPLLDFTIGKSEYLDTVVDLNPKFGFAEDG